ncbi:MAG: thiol:disulfide interchange protein DsbA/DsbL [Steroidobacteraceae bacterium]
MKHAFAVVALLGLSLAACGRDTPPPPADASLAAPPVTAPAETVRNADAAAAAPAALERAAKATQESTVAEETTDKGELKLERVAAMPESAQLPAGKWKAGTNYLPITPAQPTAAEPGRVEVLEVFWYGCSHCYALDPFLESWNKNKPANVKFVRVPVTWGAVHRAHARLFYTLEALGKGEALHTAVFDEIHKRGNFLVANDEAQTLKLQLAFAKANGISEADYTRAYNSFGVNAALQKADDITRRYRVEGVPVLFVNGKYQTDVALAGGHSQLIELVNDLAAAEKRR